MRRFLDVLEERGSLLTPGQSIRTGRNLADLFERVAGRPDKGEGSFIDKLVRETRGASPTVMQLAAEAALLNAERRRRPGRCNRLGLTRISTQVVRRNLLW